MKQRKELYKKLLKIFGGLILLALSFWKFDSVYYAVFESNTSFWDLSFDDYEGIVTGVFFLSWSITVFVCLNKKGCIKPNKTESFWDKEILK